MSDDDLREQVEDFAGRVNTTLRGVLGDLVEPLEATRLRGTLFVVETTDDSGLTLTKDGEPFLALTVRYECGWDGPETFTRVNRSEFHLLPHGETRPLIRYEFSQSAHRHRPIAHIHVHTDDARILEVMAQAGSATRTGQKHAARAEKGKAQHADLHLPVGGARFRPALEDVLHMAVEEFGIDCQPGWIERIEAGRDDWRRIQTRAVVRDAPEEAAAALESLDYVVSRPPAGAPTGSPDRLRKF